MPTDQMVCTEAWSLPKEGSKEQNDFKTRFIFSRVAAWLRLELSLVTGRGLKVASFLQEVFPACERTRQ
uniref:Uncharacterized protein n=1 Tax=Anguilla anguilla TaxID=7936 RepID=A0A0E9WVF3_ANGAN